MYESHFDMNKTPFVRDIPTESLYESPVIAEILGRLSYVADHQLFALLTAASGCGKSTIIRKFTQMLPRDKYTLLYLSDSKLTPRWFYKGLLDQLGIESKFYRGDAKRQLHKEIEVIREIRKRQVVCVLDEAHLLEKETLEEFRFLLNFNCDSISPMALILVAQSELLDKLKLQCYTAIRQRIDMNCILPRLERSDTEEYIRSHLRYAGCEHELFTEKAVDEIYRSSSGTLRIINRICEKSLMYGHQQRKKIIDDHMVRYVIENEGV
jgi:general secretion pathway protein A